MKNPKYHKVSQQMFSRPLWEYAFWFAILGLLLTGLWKFWGWSKEQQETNKCLKELATTFCEQNSGTLKYSSGIEQSFTCLISRQQIKLEFSQDEIEYCKTQTQG